MYARASIIKLSTHLYRVPTVWVIKPIPSSQKLHDKLDSGQNGLQMTSVPCQSERAKAVCGEWGKEEKREVERDGGKK